jgi:DNA polymerase-3 subunit gamma/tau
VSNQVWYRKWRPQRFAEVAGQDHVTRTLVNAVASGRVSHAYLFCGPRGTGKTTTARLLAKAVNCAQNQAGEPCGQCASCRGVAEGRALDLIEMDAASNRGIDEIRSLRDKVGYSPTSSAYKVYLIDEVHELTQHAFDALLKTLEEPPPHVIFALATTEAERVPATILSRCQRFDFRRIRVADVVGRLEEICERERVQMPEGSLDLIARRATGSLRDGINLLEQVVASCGARPDLEQVREALGMGGDARALALVRHALAAELAPCFELIAAARDEGIELKQVQRAALAALRSVLLVKAGAEASLELGEEAILDLRQIAEQSQSGAIIRLLRQLSEADFRSDPTSSLPLELALAEAILLPGETERPPAPPPDRRLPSASTPSHSRISAPSERADRGTPRAAVVRGVPEALRRPPAAVPAPAAPNAGDSEALGARAEASSHPIPPEEPAEEIVSERVVEPPVVPVELADVPAPRSQHPVSNTPVSQRITLDWAQDQMASLYSRLRERRAYAASLINSPCNIIGVDAETVTLAFKHDFLAAKLRSDENGRHQREIEDVIEGLYGRRFEVRVTVDPDVQGWRRPPATPRTSHLLDEAEKLGLRRRGEPVIESARGE